jgi:hypothetical protein
MRNHWHIIARDESACGTICASRARAREIAIKLDWLMLDLGLCPRCRFFSVGGVESDATDRWGYYPGLGLPREVGMAPAPETKIVSPAAPAHD